MVFAMVFPFGCQPGVKPTSLQRFDQRLELDSNRFVVVREGWDLAVDTKQLIDCHLGGSYRIFDSTHDIIRNLDELADKSKVLRSSGHRHGPVTAHARHEHAGDVRHSAWNATRRFDRIQIESKMTAKFAQNFFTIAIVHRLGNEIADSVLEKGVSLKYLHFLRLVREVRLMRQHNGHQPV